MPGRRVDEEKQRGDLLRSQIPGQEMEQATSLPSRSRSMQSFPGKREDDKNQIEEKRS